jgi:hypothetical protein
VPTVAYVWYSAVEDEKLLPFNSSAIITVNVPVVYMAREAMILMQGQNPLQGPASRPLSPRAM